MNGRLVEWQAVEGQHTHKKSAVTLLGSNLTPSMDLRSHECCNNPAGLWRAVLLPCSLSDSRNHVIVSVSHQLGQLAFCSNFSFCIDSIWTLCKTKTLQIIRIKICLWCDGYICFYLNIWRCSGPLTAQEERRKREIREMCDWLSSLTVLGLTWIGRGRWNEGGVRGEREKKEIELEQSNFWGRRRPSSLFLLLSLSLIATGGWRMDVSLVIVPLFRELYNTSDWSMSSFW